ncbi:MAG: hypothetical protein QM765_51405 [Myxococcales bacterium]
MPSRFLLLLALALLLPAVAHAAAPVKRVKIAVLDVRAVGAFDPKTVQGLSTLVASEAAKGPFKVYAGADLSALMGFEKQKQLLGCAESSCLAELGGALGVDYLLSTEVSEIGGVWLLSMTLLDVVHSQAANRVTQRTEKLKELIDLAQTATTEALSAIAPKADSARPDGSSPAVAQPEPKTGPKPDAAKPASATVQVAAAPQRMSTIRTAGIALDAVGAAALIGGGVCGILSLGNYDKAKSTANLADFESARSAGKTQALAADVLYGAGAVALGVGLVLTIIGGDAPAPAQPVVTAGPIPGGAAMLVTGGF